MQKAQQAQGGSEQANAGNNQQDGNSSGDAEDVEFEEVK